MKRLTRSNSFKQASAIEQEDSYINTNSDSGTPSIRRRSSPRRESFMKNEQSSSSLSSFNTTTSGTGSTSSSSTTGTSADDVNQTVNSFKNIKAHSHACLVHTTIRASPLSKESPEQNYRGFYNLALLLLAVSNLRLVLENHMKYGFLVSFPGSCLDTTDIFWAIINCLCLVVNISILYFLESLISKCTKTSTALVYLEVFTIALTISVPTFICWTFIHHPAIGGISLMIATIVFLKSISLVLVNGDLKNRKLQTSKRRKSVPLPEDESANEFKSLNAPENDDSFLAEIIEYPNNVNWKNIWYFMFAPTLCYQVNYPKTPRFRKGEFLKRVAECLLATGMMFFLTEQYAIPTLRNSINALENMSMVKLSERILKLSIFFHSFLNAMAEIMCFGDRRFYQPWWNATNISEYWRLWNIPVHQWGKRHVYLPLVKIHHFSPSFAGLVVFFISAVLHELIVGVPTHLLKGWAFWAIMSQVPLIHLSNMMKGLNKKQEKLEIFNTLGNLWFWISFTIVGQPTAIILYYSYWFKNNQVSLSN